MVFNPSQKRMNKCFNAFTGSLFDKRCGKSCVEARASFEIECTCEQLFIREVMINTSSTGSGKFANILHRGLREAFACKTGEGRIQDGLPLGFFRDAPLGISHSHNATNLFSLYMRLCSYSRSRTALFLPVFAHCNTTLTRSKF